MQGTKLWAGRSEIWILTGAKYFSFPKYPTHLWGPPTLLFSGYHRSLAGTNKAVGTWVCWLASILYQGSKWVEPYFWSPSRTLWAGRTVSSSEFIKVNGRVFSEWITNEVWYNFCCFPGIFRKGMKKGTKIPIQDTVSWVRHEQGTSNIHVTSIIVTLTYLWHFTTVKLDQWPILIWWTGTWCFPVVLLLDLTSRSGFTTVIDIISINKQRICWTRWSCCGRIQEMLAGKKRWPTGGFCSTDQRLDLSDSGYLRERAWWLTQEIFMTRHSREDGWVCSVSLRRWSSGQTWCTGAMVRHMVYSLWPILRT